ncbi:MAG: thiamine-phosphate kinase [Chitinophagaceae bacterium]|nr:MAG: thiamine-phosphate kinase [Chitinophagaceae bacterium]
MSKKNHDTNRTEVSSLGEFGLIKHLTSQFNIENTSTIKAIGDDAAVIDTNFQFSLHSTDLLIEGVHFDLMYMPLKHLGYKSVIVNLSDIYAMNAEPEQILVSIAISNRFSVEALEELYSGIQLACEKYGVDLVGGDTTTSPSGLMISITAIGRAPADEIVYRSGAKEHDLICVSGDLGAAYLGIQLLEREKQVFLDNPKMQPELTEHTYCVGRQLKPEARKDVIQSLKKNNILPTSMIDISDGLSSEMLHITESSGCGARIYEEHIPLHNDTISLASEFNISPVTAALSGGEDYELLFTVDQKDYDKIKNLTDVCVVGHITAAKEKTVIVTESGNHYPLTAQGWNAFQKQQREN